LNILAADALKKADRAFYDDGQVSLFN